MQGFWNGISDEDHDEQIEYDDEYDVMGLDTIVIVIGRELVTWLVATPWNETVECKCK